MGRREGGGEEGRRGEVGEEGVERLDLRKDDASAPPARVPDGTHYGRLTLEKKPSLTTPVSHSSRLSFSLPAPVLGSSLLPCFAPLRLLNQTSQVCLRGWISATGLSAVSGDTARPREREGPFLRCVRTCGTSAVGDSVPQAPPPVLERDGERRDGTRVDEPRVCASAGNEGSRRRGALMWAGRAGEVGAGIPEGEGARTRTETQGRGGERERSLGEPSGLGFATFLRVSDRGMFGPLGGGLVEVKSALGAGFKKEASSV